VYKVLNKDIERKTYIYARVSTAKQKKALKNQVHLLKTFCFQNGYVLNGVYQDIASGISFEKRTQFFELLDEVLVGKVKRVIVTYKDRLTRIGFDFFSYLFAKHGCELIVMSELGSTELDSEEVFDDVVHLLDSYSLNVNKKNINKTLKELLKDGSHSTS
jgi:putative resolvase